MDVEEFKDMAYLILICLLGFVGISLILGGIALFLLAIIIELDHIARIILRMPPSGVHRKSSASNMTFKPLSGPSKSKEKLI